jgi:hypothetical protein
MVDEGEILSPFGRFLFPHIFRSFRMAIQPSKLALAFAALTAIYLTGWLLDLSRTLLHSTSAASTDTGVFSALWSFADAEIQAVIAPILAFDIGRFGQSLLNTIHRWAEAVAWMFKHHPVHSIVVLAVALVALSLAGGAICRIAAVEFARDVRPGLGQAWRFAKRKLVNLIAAPITPLVIALLLGLPIILLGALGNIPYAGELLTGLLLPLALILAPFIAVVLIGTAAGLSLMFPAIAYEDSDAFDAIGRSFSHVYTRPWRLGFYALTAAVYGAICYVFVRLLAFLLLWVTHGFLQIGLRDEKLQAIWPQPTFNNLLGTTAAEPETWSLWLGAFLIRVWVLVVIGLMISFLISFYFTAGTIIYALMRNRVDGTPLDEIYEAPEETTHAPGPLESPRPGVSPDEAAGQASGTSE